MPARLLSLLPHPDDAALLLGGTLARYAGAGCEIVVLSATSGSPPQAAMENPEAAHQRTRELRAVAQELGVRDVVVLDYPGGGLHGQEPEVLGDLFFDLIRAVEPDVVITAPGEGLTEDGDQLAVHRAAKDAFFEARSLPGGSGPQPHKLYFCVWPAQHARRAMAVLKSRGLPSEAIPTPSPSPAPASAVTTIIDVRATLARKLEAVRQQRTHLDPAFDGLAPAALEDLWGQEFFVRAFPHPWITGVIERDLLAGLPAMDPAGRQAA